MERAIGVGARVEHVRRLTGGTSSAVHALRVGRPGREPMRLVLRRYALPWVLDEPHVPAQEVEVLSLLRGAGLPVPSLVAADTTGADAGVPTVLTTRLPGRCVWQPADLDPYARRLAGVLPSIHSLSLPLTRRHAPYYSAASLAPPSWSSRPDLWRRVLAVVAGQAPEFDPVFIHRDFHAGNVLWRRGRVTGIVDWVSSCIGPSGVDVGHCRHNLVRDLDIAAADRFLAAWKSAAGVTDHDPYWDLLAVVDWLPERIESGVGGAVEDYASRLVAELGR